jgi:hypothetical protein
VGLFYKLDKLEVVSATFLFSITKPFSPKQVVVGIIETQHEPSAREKKEKGNINIIHQ